MSGSISTNSTEFIDDRLELYLSSLLEGKTIVIHPIYRRDFLKYAIDRGYEEEFKLRYVSNRIKSLDDPAFPYYYEAYLKG